jgi:hypothetical protein
MRFFHQMMAAVASIMFSKTRFHSHEMSTPTLPGPHLFDHGGTNYGSGINWPSIYHARRNNRRGKIIRRYS